MVKIFLFLLITSFPVFCQMSGGDLRTDQTDSIFIRTVISIEKSDSIGINDDDILTEAFFELNGLKAKLIPLSDTKDNPEEFVSIGIFVVKNYFTVIVEYNRKALYRARTEFYEIPVPTWRKMVGGGHGSENKYILDVVSDCLQAFSKDFKDQNYL